MAKRILCLTLFAILLFAVPTAAFAAQFEDPAKVVKTAVLDETVSRKADSADNSSEGARSIWLWVAAAALSLAALGARCSVAFSAHHGRNTPDKNWNADDAWLYVKPQSKPSGEKKM